MLAFKLIFQMMLKSQSEQKSCAVLQENKLSFVWNLKVLSELSIVIITAEVNVNWLVGIKISDWDETPGLKNDKV